MLNSPCNNCQWSTPGISGSHHKGCNWHNYGQFNLLTCAFKGIINGSHIKINEHGAKNGWAEWPLDFDPIWIEECVLKNIPMKDSDEK